MSRILTKPALKRYLKQRDFKALAKHNIHPKIDGTGYIDYRSLPDWALGVARKEAGDE